MLSLAMTHLIDSPTELSTRQCTSKCCMNCRYSNANCDMIDTKYSSKVKLLEHLMTSSNLTYWCNKKNKWRPYWCTKPILVHIGIAKPILNSFCMQTISFVQGGKTRLSVVLLPLNLASRQLAVSPSYSPMGKFRQEQHLRLSDRNSALMT